ncbi:hypothetical protein [Mesorhizobium carmichaelinearum]|uniref:hypothetical protein n=1 Tax=Mesorhizobium carmichaelinearum TaxID=1208188 RepID=UPI000BA2D9D6|nr:hypothetical protein [Mesorhizobium carmichaelinearum]
MFGSRVDHIGQLEIFGAFAAKNPEQLLKDFRFFDEPDRLRRPQRLAAVTIIHAATLQAIFGPGDFWLALARPIGWMGTVGDPPQRWRAVII